ncbi:hypothetical protein K437DRAFT_64410 [Tilletiaria anomala UBC 951]|uniref:Uncharacterized protein n=1 Tax=Tilletiaria anomala (strain ATCC 24038 / CBS 436.72 / UBC 951) TaxID=1037660 RepID=A0A066VBM2_TILAU|nr:uncharacterized protein K437DRAFT_64410 [Tilletiaria anomala UBC 951]KDN35980.1 hypothetical protein K437DRAFT_64410 [Tilletiaria anomala UBC 951]
MTLTSAPINESTVAGSAAPPSTSAHAHAPTLRRITNGISSAAGANTELRAQLRREREREKEREAASVSGSAPAPLFASVSASQPPLIVSARKADGAGSVQPSISAPALLAAAQQRPQPQASQQRPKAGSPPSSAPVAGAAMPSKGTAHSKQAVSGSASAPPSGAASVAQKVMSRFASNSSLASAISMQSASSSSAFSGHHQHHRQHTGSVVDPSTSTASQLQHGPVPSDALLTGMTSNQAGAGREDAEDAEEDEVEDALPRRRYRGHSGGDDVALSSIGEHPAGNSVEAAAAAQPSNDRSRAETTASGSSSMTSFSSIGGSSSLLLSSTSSMGSSDTTVSIATSSQPQHVPTQMHASHGPATTMHFAPIQQDLSMPVSSISLSPWSSAKPSSGSDSISRNHIRTSSSYESFDGPVGIEALKEAFSAKYYELAAKCKNWERYSAKLRAQAEALEVENRLLRDMSSNYELKVTDLQAQLRTVRDEAWTWEEMVKSTQKRVSELEAHISLSERDQHFVGGILRDLPSAPSSGEQPTSIIHQSSSLSSALFSPTGEDSGANGALRASRSGSARTFHGTDSYGSSAVEGAPAAPASLVNTALPAPLQQMLAQAHEDHRRLQEQAIASNLDMSCAPRRSSSRGGGGSMLRTAAENRWRDPHRRSDSTVSIAEVLAQDAAHRDAAAAHGENSHRLSSWRCHEQNGMQAPASAPLPSVATFSGITSKALSMLESQHHAKLHAMNRPVASTSQQDPPPVWGSHQRAPSVDGHVLGTSKAASSTQQKRRGLQRKSWDRSQRSDDSAAILPGEPKRESISEAQHQIGVTEFLQSYVDQRKHARRESAPAQQQQPQAQAQQQQQLRSANTSASNPPSRSTSRLSNHSAADSRVGGRTRPSSRASSLHDYIPEDKDDLFSPDASENVSAFASTSQLTSNISGNSSNECAKSPTIVDAADLYQSRFLPYGPLVSTPLYEPSEQELWMPLVDRGVNVQTLSPPGDRTEHAQQPSAPTSEEDSSGSHVSKPLTHDELVEHRQIYSRLRRELSQEDLQKFEMYVRRYDLMDIPLEGPRGLLVRVKKLLLLSDSRIRQQPEKKALRKQLAREFERVCRSAHA